MNNKYLYIIPHVVFRV